MAWRETTPGPRGERRGQTTAHGNATPGQANPDNQQPAIPARAGRHRVPCPQCDKGAGDRALSILVDPDGSACWLCWRCEWSGGTRGTTHGPTVETREQDDSESKRRRLRRHWRESEPLELWSHYPAAKYFKVRGLDLVLDPPADLRFSWRLPYWAPEGDKPTHQGDYPAILAVIRDPDGEAVGLHRTYLATDGNGKAPVSAPRKLCPPARPNGYRGGAVRLYEAGETLAVAEGIETALAVRKATGRPTWSCISAHGLKTVYLPPQSHDVLIAADHDEAGIEAANALARRLTREGRIARIAVPDTPGADWADEVGGLPA